ncbi:sensor histidine kinase [Peribacillus alkalitolerans]|uniref:sensor histidine kinase n=1 Tax=Peribacillus alkalitolerans TaxID=1550385 RepID=UPI0013D39D70|nr:ATP-binding protein [Peribacillus alkalitolerans]
MVLYQINDSYFHFSQILFPSFQWIGWILLVLVCVFCYMREKIKIGHALSWKSRLITNTIKTSHSIDSLQELHQIAEKLIKRTIQEKKCYICWFQNHLWIEDWFTNYYSRQLIEHNGIWWNTQRSIRLTNYIGEEQSFNFYPLYVKGSEGNIGAILIPVTKNNTYSVQNHVLLNVILAWIVNQSKRIEQDKKLSREVKSSVQHSVSQDIHDGIAQQLFFLSTLLFQVKSAVKRQGEDNVQLLVEKMEAQLSQSQLEIRSLISTLREENQTINLFEAIQHFINKSKRNTTTEIRLITKGSIAQEAAEIEEIIYRFIQEAVNNSIKHAVATRIDIHIEVNIVQWIVKVQDNGVGIEKKTIPGRYGLVGIREKISKAGGQMHIHSENRNGTEVIAIIPRGSIRNND